MSDKNKYDSLDYFKILESSIMTSEDDLKNNYRRLAKFWHPDHNTSPDALDTFQKISTAYDYLQDSKSRLRYILLSMVYNKTNFPNMDAICILKNMQGRDDLNMRAFNLTEVTGKILGHTKIEKTYFCSINEASHVIKKITEHNWLYGFWGISAFFLNISALIRNIINIDSKKENLLLMIHNAVAFDLMGKSSEAATLATLAKNYASPEEINYINQYLDVLNTSPYCFDKKWNFSKLKKLQLFYPFIAFSCIFAICSVLYLKQENLKEINSVNLKEEIIMQNGQKMYSDLAVAKFFDIPVNTQDKSKLYYLIQKTNAMHGADREFDVLREVEQGTTVRITGFTTDNKWFRVMFDNGEMGFIEAKYLKQGIGNEIPLWSKIYREE